MSAIPKKLVSLVIRTVASITSRGMNLFEKATGETPDTELLAAACKQLDGILKKINNKIPLLQVNGTKFTPGESGPGADENKPPRIK